MFQILVYGACRSGELAVTYHYKDTNDTIKYSDIELFLYLDGEEHVRIGAIITFRLMKGRRNNDAE